jgi:hypothetical protein
MEGSEQWIYFFLIHAKRKKKAKERKEEKG